MATCRETVETEAHITIATGLEITTEIMTLTDQVEETAPASDVGPEIGTMVETIDAEVGIENLGATGTILVTTLDADGILLLTQEERVQEEIAG